MLLVNRKYILNFFIPACLILTLLLQGIVYAHFLAVDSVKSQGNSSLDEMAVQTPINHTYFLTLIIAILVVILCIVVVLFIVHHSRLKAQIMLSMKDELTGVFCRNYLTMHLPALRSRFERELNPELSLGALIIDCDDFKFINDTFGHAGGDKALKAIVNTISSQIREHDLLLRWGGDEFVLLCESVSQIQMCELAQRIISSINDMFIEYERATLSVTVSVGYALHDKTKAFNLDNLVNKADEYLLATKKSGKNSFLGNKSFPLVSQHFANS